VKIKTSLKLSLSITIFLFFFFLFNHQEKHTLEKLEIKTTTKEDNNDLIESINMLKDDVLSLKEELKIFKEEFNNFTLNVEYKTNQDKPLVQTLTNFDPYAINEVAKPIQTKKNSSYNQSKKDALELLMTTDVFDNIQDTDE